MYVIAHLIAVPVATGAARGYSSTTTVLTAGGIYVGGVGASVWSAMMLVSVLFTVQYGRQPNPKEQRITGVIVNLLILAIAAQAMVRTRMVWDAGNHEGFRVIHNQDDIIRLALIVFSGICLLRLYQVMLQTSVKGERFRSPLFHLLKKIVPYTIILIVVRFGAAGYKFIYGQGIYSIPENAAGWQIFWMYVYGLLLPAASLGFMAAFIYATAGIGHLSKY
jgi:hypothetical protein